MKTRTTATLIFSLLLAATVAQAAPSKAKSTARATSAPAAKATAAATATATAKKSKLSKDIRFSGSQVDGKYLSAGESIAEVEGDKEMGALVGVRKNFRDRLKTETARLANAQNEPQAARSGKGN